MPVAGAEDDGLLEWAALRIAGEELGEQVVAHRVDPIRQEQTSLEVGLLVHSGDFCGAERLAGVRVSRIAGDDVRKRQSRRVEVHLGHLDLARGEVAVLHRLREAVLVHRIAKIPEVVGGHLGVRLGFLRVLITLDLSRRRGQADLYGIGVSSQHDGPFAPRGTVALVDDDVREVVLRIMAEEERRIAVLAIDPERLVGGNVHASVFSVIPSSVFIVYLSGVGTEDALHRFQPLRPQLVAVAEEERAFELARVGDPLEQVDRNEGLARAGRKRQQRTWWSTFRGTAGSLFEDRSNRRVLEIASLTLAAGISREQRLGDRRLQ